MCCEGEAGPITCPPAAVTIDSDRSALQAPDTQTGARRANSDELNPVSATYRLGLFITSVACAAYGHGQARGRVSSKPPGDLDRGWPRRISRQGGLGAANGWKGGARGRRGQREAGPHIDALYWPAPQFFDTSKRADPGVSMRRNHRWLRIRPPVKPIRLAEIAAMPYTPESEFAVTAD